MASTTHADTEGESRLAIARRRVDAIRHGSFPPPPDLTTIPAPPPRTSPKKKCTNVNCWSHRLFGPEVELPWLEFYKASNLNSGLQSQCITCLGIAKGMLPELPDALPVPTAELPDLPTDNDGSARRDPQQREEEPPAPDREPPPPVQATAPPPPEPPRPTEPPPPPVVTLPSAPRHPTPTALGLGPIPFFQFTDADGDRFLVAFGIGPLIGLGKVGDAKVMIHLPFTPGDAPQTYTIVGDEAERLELQLRQLVVETHATDATMLEEAVVLWERAQAAKERAEAKIDRIQAQAQALLDTAQAETRSALARAAETEQKRLKAAQALTEMEHKLHGLQRQMRMMERTEAGALAVKVTDLEQQLQQAQLDLAEERQRHAEDNERLAMARSKIEQYRRDYQADRGNTTMGHALQEAGVTS